MLAGQPDTPPWTMLADDGERATFYAGPATVELHRTETANYRDNLATGSPALWVVLRETGAEPPYALYLVTADPAEGEGMTEAGNNIVEPVPMPDTGARRDCGFRRRAPCRGGVREAQARPGRSGIARAPPAGGAKGRAMTDRDDSSEGFLERWSRKKIEARARSA